MSRRQICGCGHEVDLPVCSSSVPLSHCVRSLFAYRVAVVVVFSGPSLSAYARFVFLVSVGVAGRRGERRAVFVSSSWRLVRR